MDMHLYHVTTPEHWEQIRIQGLIPQIGDNSKLCDEDAPFVYLCDRDSLAYWQILLQAPVILQLPETVLTEYPLCYNDYSNYIEYRCEKPISQDQIQRVYLYPKQTTAMRQLCQNYLAEIDEAFRSLKRYDRGWEADPKSLALYLESVANILSRLDYTVCNPEMIKDNFPIITPDGSLPSLKWFQDTLLRHPQDVLTKARKTLYTQLERCFAPFLGKGETYETGTYPLTC